MHISEGVLSAPVLLTGAVLTAGGTAVGLKKLDYERMAPVALLSAAFFVASLVHVNIGPCSSHLVLNGLLGILLGWAAFPAVLVGLTLQAIFFQYGGITVLGVNTLNMALPAVLGYLLFGRRVCKKGPGALAAAAACGSLAVLLSAVMVAASLVFSDQNFREIAALLLAAHLPVIIIEGIVSGFCVAFVRKVQPALLPGWDFCPSGDGADGISADPQRARTAGDNR